MIPVFFLLLFLVVVLYAALSVVKPKNFPPGPKWYPFIGSAKTVEQLVKKNKSQYKAFIELSKQYSTNVLGLNNSGDYLIVLFGRENVRKAFLEGEFDYRPMSFFAKLRCLGKENVGITYANGQLWKEHRQFAVKNLKNVGFGKSKMEKEIQNELIRVVDQIKMHNGDPISMKTMLGEAVMNILWKYVAGEQIQKHKLRNLIHLFKERGNAFSLVGGTILNQAPWCRFIIPEFSGYSLIQKINAEISEIIEETINKHKNKEIKGNDFIYSFLKEINGTNTTFTEEQLKMVCLDFFIAGSQATSNMTEYALLRAMISPEIQEKIHNEIDSLLGDNLPCWNDNERMVYTSAYLLEILRYYDIVPAAGPRTVYKDTKIEGYTIPKNSTVLISLSDLQHDPALWGDPHRFRPERFIDEEGKLKNPDNLYSFGLGRRRCPGDSLAKSYVFLTFVGIMQKFRIQCSGEMPSDEPIIGILGSPPPFTAEFKLRK